MIDKKNILFVFPYPSNQSPSQRFRFEQYLNALNADGFHNVLKPLLTLSAWNILYQRGYTFKKIGWLLLGFLKRLLLLFSIYRFDFIFIHREATPAGPPWFEWIVARVFQKKIIYDFDDAIWLTDREKESHVFRTLKWRNKVASICRWSYKISCGNAYLADYARQYNRQVIINPPTIDTENHHNRGLYRESIKNNNQSITVGWTGSHSTLKYLELLEPVLQRIERNYTTVEFLVIADKPPKLKLSNLKFVPWNEETEIKDLLETDIGIMPLPDDEWSKGKCGFKALQYMALEIPAVLSPVGVNTEIVTNGVEGFLCTTDEEWFTCLEKLILDGELRKTMGALGRKKVVEHYSVSSNSPNFLSLFT